MDSSLDPSVVFQLAGITVGSTIGAAYLGVMFASILYGLTCCQTLNYYRSSKSSSDGWVLKTMVGLLWILDTIHQAMLFHIGYHYLVLGYDSPLTLLSVSWSISTEMLLNFVIGAIVQAFYIWRIWIFSRNVWISGFCGIWMLAAFGYGIVYPIKTYIFPSMYFAQHTFKTLTVAGSCLTLAGDVLMALIMAYYLYTSRTGFRSTDGIITKLILLTVATGGLTASIWMASFLSLVVAPGTLYDLLFDPMISKLYANSVLTMLNAREFIPLSDARNNAASGIRLNPLPSVDLATQTSSTQENPLTINISTSTGDILKRSMDRKPALDHV